MRAIVRGLARGQHPHRVARLDACRRRSGRQKPRKSRLGRLTHCTGMRNGLAWSALIVELDGLEVLDQRRARVPGRVVARASVMLSPSKPEIGIGGEVGDPDAARRTRGSRRRCASNICLVVVDQVHLVDRQHDVADADQVSEVAVAPGLLSTPLRASIRITARSAVEAPVTMLRVYCSWPGRVGDDELALVGGEEAIGDVDRDALLALGGEAVDQQREIDLLALRADALAVGFERGELVLEDHLGIVEQPADQRGLAVVDAAAGDEAQQRLVLVLRADRRRCPAAIRASAGRLSGSVAIRNSPPASSSPCWPPASLSITRPWRSLVVVSSISWITSGSVAASLSTAPVSG